MINEISLLMYEWLISFVKKSLLFPLQQKSEIQISEIIRPQLKNWDCLIGLQKRGLIL